MPQVVANSDREWKALTQNKSAKIIRTREDWQKFLHTKNSPLKGVDKQVVDEFSKSLVFRNNGLAGAQYESLARATTFFQFRQTFAGFGIGLGLFADYEDKECLSRGTCGPRFGYVCTSNC